MKTLLVLFLFLLSLLSCQDTNCSGKDVSEDMEEPVDTTPKATAIFWVDKDKDYQAKKKDGPLSLRTVKARVEIDSLGKVNLLAYTKPQSQRIKSYLQYRLEEFRVKKVMLDLSLIHISEPTRQAEISYAVFCLKKKKKNEKNMERFGSRLRRIGGEFHYK